MSGAGDVSRHGLGGSKGQDAREEAEPSGVGEKRSAGTTVMVAAHNGEGEG